MVSGRLHYYVKFLGEPDIFDGTGKVKFPFLKAKVLAMLVLEEKHISRDEVIALLWSEKTYDSGKRNLNNALCCIRTIVPIIVAEHGFLTIAKDVIIDSDIDLLENVMTIDIATLDRMFDGYMNLPRLDDIPMFEEWLRNKREFYRSLLVENVKKRSVRMLQADSQCALNDAIKCYELLAQYEPYDEVVNGELVRLYIKADKKIEAAMAAKRFSKNVERDLGIEMPFNDPASSAACSAATAGVKALRLPTDENPLLRTNELVRILAFMSEDVCVDTDLPSSVFIWGEEGIGKNSLITDVTSRLANIGWKSNRIKCYQEELNRPLSSVLKFLHEGTDDFNGECEYLTEKNIPFIVQMLVKRCASHNNNSLLVVENIQWMDSSSWMILEAVIWNKESPRYIIISGYEEAKSLFMHRVGFIGETFRKLEITLNRFTREETKLICKKLKPDFEWTDSHLDDIYSKTEGNPFFINEILSNLGEDTDSIVQNTESRFLYRAEILSKTDRLFLDAIAVLGDGASMLQLSQILNLDLVILAECYTNIKLQGLVREYKDESGYVYYTFTHPRIREDFLANMSETLKKALHIKFIDCMEHNVSNIAMSWREYSLLISHSEQANLSIKELKWRLLELRNHFRCTHVLSPIISDQEIAVYNPSSDDIEYTPSALGKASRLLDKVIRKNGRTAEISSFECQLMLLEGGYLCWTGDFSGASGVLNEALVKAERLNFELLIIEICEQLCYLAQKTNNARKLDLFAKKTFKLAMLNHNHVWIGTSIRFIATANVMRGSYVSAEKLLNMSVRLFEKMEHDGCSYTTSIIAVEHIKGNINLAKGDYAAALIHFKNCMYMGESLVLHSGQSVFFAKAAYCLIRLGENSEASSILLRAERLYNMIRSDCAHLNSIVQNSVIIYTMLGYIKAKAGEWSSAENYWLNVEIITKGKTCRVCEGIMYWCKWSVLDCADSPPDGFSASFLSRGKEWYWESFKATQGLSTWNC